MSTNVHNIKNITFVLFVCENKHNTSQQEKYKHFQTNKKQDSAKTCVCVCYSASSGIHYSVGSKIIFFFSIILYVISSTTCSQPPPTPTATGCGSSRLPIRLQEKKKEKKNGSQSGAGSLRWCQKALRTGSFIIDEHLLPPKTRLAAAEALLTFKLLEESGSKNQLRFHGLWSYSREMAKKWKGVLRPKLCYKSLKGGQWCGNP